MGGEEASIKGSKHNSMKLETERIVGSKVTFLEVPF